MPPTLRVAAQNVLLGDGSDIRPATIDIDSDTGKVIAVYSDGQWPVGEPSQTIHVPDHCVVLPGLIE
jgi:hypothetical protein